MKPTGESRRVVIATYNVHGGVGSDRRYDPYRSAAVLGEIGADIYGLQEVDSRPRRGHELDQFHLFGWLTGFHVVAGPNIVRGLHRYGNALLSRWPIRRTSLHDVSVGGFERRGIIDVELDIDGMPLRVMTTHLGLRRHERRIQLSRLSTILDQDEAVSTVVMGDFNIWGWENATLHRLGHPPLAGARSWPARCPLFRFDRIWTRPATLCGKVVAHRTALAQRASDHLPVVATVALPFTSCRVPDAVVTCRPTQGGAP